MPGRTIADAMMIGLAALFLVLPGFLSDIVALALLLPPVRGWIYARAGQPRDGGRRTAGYPPRTGAGRSARSTARARSISTRTTIARASRRTAAALVRSRQRC